MRFIHFAVCLALASVGWADDEVFVTGPYMLSGLITDTSKVPPRQATNFPTSQTATQPTAAFVNNREAVWEFSADQYIVWSFPVAPPKSDHILELQFGTICANFQMSIVDAIGKVLVDWRTSEQATVDTEGPDYSVCEKAWFSYLKVDLSTFDTTKFTLHVFSPYPPTAYMVLSDIISVWHVGVQDPNYGLWVLKMPPNQCETYDGAFTVSCESGVFDLDPSHQNLVAGGFIGDNDFYQGGQDFPDYLPDTFDNFAVVDMAWLSTYAFSGLTNPIIELDVFQQSPGIGAESSAFRTFGMIVISGTYDNNPLDIGTFTNAITAGTSSAYTYGVPALFAGFNQNGWKNSVAFGNAVMNIFLKVYAGAFTSGRALQLNNMASWNPKDDDITTDFTLVDGTLQQECGSYPVFLNNGGDVFRGLAFLWNYEDGFPQHPYSFWMECAQGPNVASFNFTIPTTARTDYACPWMSITAMDIYGEEQISQIGAKFDTQVWEPNQWQITDSIGQIFFMQYLPSRPVFGQQLYTLTMSLLDVAPGPATLSTRPREGEGGYTALAVFPFFRFFDIQGPCGVPTCDEILSQRGTGGYFNQSCGLDDTRRALFATNLPKSRNCSAEHDNVNYAFVHIDADPQPWVNPFGLPIVVTNWGEANWGVITSFTPTPSSYETMGITPQDNLGPYVGAIMFLLTIDKGHHNGTLDYSPTTFQIISVEPLVNVLVFDEANRNGVPLESVEGASLEMKATNVYELVIPGSCIGVAAYDVGIGPSPDEGSDEALLGLLGLLAVPFCLLSLSMACAWALMNRKKPIPPPPQMYVPVQEVFAPVQEMYWSEVPTYTVPQMGYGVSGFQPAPAPIPSPVW